MPPERNHVGLMVGRSSTRARESMCHTITQKGLPLITALQGRAFGRINSSLAKVGTSIRMIFLKWKNLDQRNNQSLKGAVVVTLCQNDTDVKCQMDIDFHISLTEQAGRIRLTHSSKFLLKAQGKYPVV